MSVQPQTFRFSDETMDKAREIAARYPKGRQASALLPLLDLAQRQQGGWLPRAAISEVARLLSVPEIKAFEVASFYSMFNLEPVGQYLVQLCRTTPCWLKGGEAIARACEEALGIKIGETTEDGLFTLKEVECLGACVNAPVMQINDDLYEDLTPELTAYILKELSHGRTPDVGSYKVGGTCSCHGTCEGGGDA